jgi:Fe-S cluster assembly ATP-binding protein
MNNPEQKQNLLDIQNLKVRVEKKVILSDVSLHLKEKENYILFGPNGSGKTTLLHAIMGVQPYEIDAGTILFQGKDISQMAVDERAQLGISLAFQSPPEITGIQLGDLLKRILRRNLKEDFTKDEQKFIEAFNLSTFLNREINVGFSGGERKRAEILQLLFLKPRLLLLDEPDSGVDVESLRLIATEIQKYVESTGSSTLIVTHQGDILNYIKASYACVLLKGQSHCFADPKHIFETIKEYGYEECVSCQRQVPEAR